MVARERQGLLTHIQPFDRLRSRERYMNPKGSSMSKHLQHFRAAREPCRHQSILSLITKPTGFLPSFDIDEKSSRPLLDADRRRATPSEKSPLHRQSFQRATLGVVAQIHSHGSGFLTQEIG